MNAVNFKTGLPMLIKNVCCTRALKALLFLLLMGSGGEGWGQVTIASDGLNNSSSLFTISGGAYYSGNSATGDRPASSPFFTEGTHGYGINATSTSVATATLTTTNNINTTGFTSIQLSFKLSAFSIGSTGNGLDGSDLVSVEIASDGINYLAYLNINGFGNAYWPFSGSATATTAYPTVTSVAPTTGGASTTPQYGTVTVTNLPATTTLKVRISMSNNATAERWVIDDFKIVGTPVGNTAPILSSPTSADITNLSANLGATITSNGGVAVTESGVVYGTTAAPTGNATQTSPLVTSGVFTVPVSSLNPQTQYFYRGYAINTEGTGYSPDGNFRTLSNPPTGQATGLAGTATSTTALNLTWTAATFPGSGATTKGYVLLRATSPNTPSLANANGAAPAAGANTTIVSSTIAEGATSQASTGLTVNTTYNYLLVPFCWDGANAATYHYLTASAPTAAASTPSNLSDVIAVASSESVTISSLINDPAPLTSATGVQVWQFTVRDGGASLNDVDLLPTIISGFTLTTGVGNAMDNWLDAIKTVALFDGTTWLADASSIAASTIVFSGLNLSVADNTSKTFSLRLSLNETLNNIGSGNLDGDDFVFSLTNANFTTPTDGTSSTKASFSAASSTNGQNAVDIIATKLLFVQQPVNITINTNLTPAVTIQATDIGGNRDRDFAAAIDVTATGATLTGSPVSTNASLGLATFSTLQFSTTGNGVTLQANTAGFTEINSNPFNVSLPLSSFVYRTRVVTGNWHTVDSGNETWERSSDGGTNWSPADIAPNNTAGTVLIRAGHTITIDAASVSLDELTIEATGRLNISSGRTLTIEDKAGEDDIILNGILSNAGTITQIGSSTIAFNSGSEYIHAKDGGTIPTGAYHMNSTINVTGVTGNLPIFSSSATYGNVIWGCNGQSGTLNFSGALRNIAGNLTITNTNSNILRLTGGTGYTFTIGGNLIINSATANMQIANGTSLGNILNVGGWNQTNGIFNTNTGSSIVAVNFTGANGSFIQSGGTLTNTVINWTVNSLASLTLNNDLPVATSRSLTVNGKLNTGATSAVTGAGACTISATGTLETSNTGGINTAIAVSGTKTYTAGASYIFNAATATAFPTTVQQPTFGNPANVTANANITLGRPIIATGDVNLTDKIITVNTPNSLTLGGTLTRTSGTVAGTGTVVFTGPATIPAGLFAANTVNGGLTIDRAGGVSLSSDLTINGALTFTSGKLAIGANNLSLAGTVSGASATNSLSGGSNAVLTISGTGALGTIFFDQTTDGSTNALKNMTVNRISAGTLTLGNKLVLLDTYTPTDGLLTTGGFLSLRSTSALTARIAAGSAAGGYISGNVTVERYISNANAGVAGRKWRLLSGQATTTTQSVFDSWQEGGAAVTDLGTWITSNTHTGSNGYDATSLGSSILTHNSAVPSWETPTATNTGALSDQQGYMLFVRGDRTALPGNTVNNPTVLRSTGTLKQGTQPAININNSNPGFTLVGNPFASPIDMENILGTTNLSQTFQVWDATEPGNFTVGGYRAVTKLGPGTYTATPASGNDASLRYIHSGQAFFVKTDGMGNASLQLAESHKASDLSVVNPIAPVAGDQQIYAELVSVNPGPAEAVVDGFRVWYNNGFSAAVTGEDIVKLGNFGENLSSYREGKRLIIELRPMIGTRDTIFLRTSNMQQKDYRFKINTIDFVQTNKTAFLEDAWLNTSTPINLNGSVNTLNFSVTTDPVSANPDRFRIVFASNGPLPVTITSIKAAQTAGPGGQGNAVAVEWKASNQLNMKQYEVEKSTDGINFSKVNTQNAIGVNGSDATYTWLDVNPVTGNNFYRIRSIGTGGDEKLTQVVVVKIGKGSPAITVYPSPVVNRTMNLQFSDMEKGIYQLRLISTAGQLVMAKTINHPGGSAAQNLALDKAVAAGNYKLEIRRPDNSVITKSILIAD